MLGPLLGSLLGDGEVLCEHVGASAPLGSWERAITEGKSGAGVSRQPVKFQGCWYPNHCTSHRPAALLLSWNGVIHTWANLSLPEIFQGIVLWVHLPPSLIMENISLKAFSVGRHAFNCSLSFWTDQINHPQQMLSSKNKSCKVSQWIYSPCYHWMTNISAFY